jgi:hypothetical protein
MYNILIQNSYFSRQNAIDDLTERPNIGYVFTENSVYSSGNNPIIDDEYFNQCSELQKTVYKSSKYPNKTQAVIRGLPNAFPIVTKKGNKSLEFYQDSTSDFYHFTRELERNLDLLLEGRARGIDTLIVSAGGFATDRAGLPFYHASYLKDFLKRTLELDTQIEPHENIPSFYGLVPINKLGS